jgi:hypothetical protein
MRPALAISFLVIALLNAALVLAQDGPLLGNAQAAFLDRINAYRRGAGNQPIVWNDNLAAAAYAEISNCPSYARGTADPPGGALKREYIQEGLPLESAVDQWCFFRSNSIPLWREYGCPALILDSNVRPKYPDLHYYATM